MTRASCILIRILSVRTTITRFLDVIFYQTDKDYFRLKRWLWFVCFFSDVYFVELNWENDRIFFCISYNQGKNNAEWNGWETVWKGKVRKTKKIGVRVRKEMKWNRAKESNQKGKIKKRTAEQAKKMKTSNDDHTRTQNRI